VLNLKISCSMTSAVKPSPLATKSHSLEWLFCVLVLLCLTACNDQPGVQQLSGATMGTTWHVTYVDPATGLAPVAAQRGIAAALQAVNLSMSTYLPDSEISRFNATPAGAVFQASPDFYQVLSAALEVGKQSEGAYDVTVAPLVALWGFGPAGAVTTPPSQEAINAQLATVGQGKLRVAGAGLLVTKLAAVSVDLSSLAKGFAVDQVAQWLAGQGVDRFLVEVGGEMKLAGLSHRGDKWQIAIEEPRYGGRSVASAISLTDIAVATSGDYRNYFEVEGKRYSHSIDPRTGYPVAHDLVSVTVAHSSAMMADAWATALTVLGSERAMAVAQGQGLAVYFIQRADEDFVHTHTPAFAPYLVAPDP
jgi:thiamine biosynthesis lipoprotein